MKLRLHQSLIWNEVDELHAEALGEDLVYSIGKMDFIFKIGRRHTTCPYKMVIKTNLDISDKGRGRLMLPYTDYWVMEVNQHGAPFLISSSEHSRGIYFTAITFRYDVD